MSVSLRKSEISHPCRRDALRLMAGGILGCAADTRSGAFTIGPAQPALTITGLKVTPIALPDPPLLNVGGCHGPYFLRNIVELRTDSGIIGIGETHGGENVTTALERRKSRDRPKRLCVPRIRRELQALNMSCYAGIELACLDACGRATGRRLCELVGGPVRDPVEFAAYLFFRYAADHPVILSDPHVVDTRGRGDRALDSWGEVRTPEAMAAMAARFRDRWGFRVFKLKGGVLAPELEAETLKAMSARLGPTPCFGSTPTDAGRPTTAIRIGNQIKQLPMEYYEDPVQGQAAMAEVRRETGLKMSTNMCVTSFAHIPEALKTKADRRFALRSPLLRRFCGLPGISTLLRAGRLDIEPAQ